MTEDDKRFVEEWESYLTSVEFEDHVAEGITRLLSIIRRQERALDYVIKYAAQEEFNPNWVLELQAILTEASES